MVLFQDKSREKMDMSIAERWKRSYQLPPDIEQALQRLIALFRDHRVSGGENG
jgi:hypothetical protein